MISVFLIYKGHVVEKKNENEYWFNGESYPTLEQAQAAVDNW
jgi:hypothetical protein